MRKSDVPSHLVACAVMLGAAQQVHVPCGKRSPQDCGVKTCRAVWEAVGTRGQKPSVYFGKTKGLQGLTKTRQNQQESSKEKK